LSALYAKRTTYLSPDGVSPIESCLFVEVGPKLALLSRWSRQPREASA